MNPSVDISYPLENLLLNDVNRVDQVSKTAGGKGLNVTRVIQQLGGDVVASGVLGGHLGDTIKEQLDKNNIQHEFFPIAQETRNSIALLHDNGQQTEILEAGPVVQTEEIAGFMNTFKELIEKADLLTISGSLAKGLPSNFYTNLISIAKQTGKDTLLDSSGSALKDALKHKDKPLLIKPNLTEVNELLDSALELTQPEEIKHTLKHSLLDGVEWVVVTLGGDGAIVKHHDHFYRVTLPKLDIVNPVGSGDATIAGFAYALEKADSVENTIKFGMTAGVLNALEPKTGHINANHLHTIWQQITIASF